MEFKNMNYCWLLEEISQSKNLTGLYIADIDGVYNKTANPYKAKQFRSQVEAEQWLDKSRIWVYEGVVAFKAVKHGFDKKEDMVNHPKHYTFGTIEVITVIDDWKLGFYEGQVIKYVGRAKHKGNELEDLKKAQWYLNRKIEQLQKEK